MFIKKYQKNKLANQAITAKNSIKWAKNSIFTFEVIRDRRRKKRSKRSSRLSVFLGVRRIKSFGLNILSNLER